MVDVQTKVVGKISQRAPLETIMSENGLGRGNLMPTHQVKNVPIEKMPAFAEQGLPINLTELTVLSSYPHHITMARKDDDEKVTVVQQAVYPVPDIPIKDLLDSIP